MSGEQFHHCVLLRILLGITTTLGEPQASLTSEPSDLSGTLCQSVVMTCSTQQLQSLRWYFDGSSEAIYVFSSTTSFPENIYQENGITIEVTRAIPESSRSDIFNGTSVLTATTSALSLLGINNIRCGTNAHRSETIDLTMLSIQTSAPSPTIECSLTSSSGALVVSIQWSPSFTSQHAVERYHVSVSPDPSSCSSDQVNPNLVYTCSGLMLRGLYQFNISGVNCGDQGGDKASFTVEPLAPQINTDVFVKPIYNEKAELRDIIVNWREEHQSHISGICILRQIQYMITLSEAGSGNIVAQRVTTSSGCKNSQCNITFSGINFRSSLKYLVSIKASVGVGGDSGNVTSMPIDGSINLNVNFTFSNCSTEVLCASPGNDGSCSIEYGLDPFYQDLSLPIQTSLNSPITLPFLRPSTYFYLVTATLNSTFQIRGNFSNAEFAARLTTSNTILLAVGVAVLCLDILLLIVLMLMEMKTKKDLGIIVRLLVGGILMVMSAMLWVAVGFQVGLQHNTCESSWRAARNALIVSAHILADSAFLIFVVVLNMIFSNIKAIKERFRSEKADHTPQVKTECHVYDEKAESGSHSKSKSHVYDDRSMASNDKDKIEMKRNVVYAENISMKKNVVYGMSNKMTSKPGVKDYYEDV